MNIIEGLLQGLGNTVATPEDAAEMRSYAGLDPAYNKQMYDIQKAADTSRRVREANAQLRGAIAQSGGQITPEMISVMAEIDPQQAFEMLQKQREQELEAQKQAMLMQAATSQDPNVLRALGVATGNTAAVTAAGQLRPNWQYSQDMRTFYDANSQQMPIAGAPSPMSFQGTATPPLPQAMPQPAPQLDTLPDFMPATGGAQTAPTLQNPLAGVDTSGMTPAEIAATKQKSIDKILSAQQETTQKATDKTKGKEQFTKAVKIAEDVMNRFYDSGYGVDEKNSAIENLYESSMSGELGQKIATKFGSDRATALQELSSIKPLILSSIMQATGQSAKQLDSNRELQFYLSSLGDPTNTRQANMSILNNINKMFGMGSEGQAQQFTPVPTESLATMSPAERQAYRQKLMQMRGQ